MNPEPLDLHFTPLELIAVILAVGILALVTQDGETNWLEGALLIAVYAIIGLAFYNLPLGWTATRASDACAISGKWQCVSVRPLPPSG